MAATSKHEANVLHRAVESVGTEGQKAKTTANQTQQVADKLTIDLNNESLAPKDTENRRQTLEEELEFMRKVNEQGSGLSSTANRTRRAISMTTETKKTPDGFLRSNEMSDIFLKFDVNGDGAIDETEFILDNWSILKLGDPDYARLFYFFNRNGKYTYYQAKYQNAMPKFKSGFSHLLPANSRYSAKRTYMEV